MTLPMTEQAMDEDAILVEAVRRGGPEAFRQVVERYQSAVFALAMSRLRDFHRAEDVAQQVFLEAYQRLGSLKDPAKLGGWLRTITIRQSVNSVRKKREEVQFESDGLDGLLVGDAVEDIERRELERQVRGAIGRLKKAHRDTTTLYYVDGYSIDEVASILEVPIGTVKRRLHTARAILKTEMLDLVKDALSSEKPGDDFGEQVFELIRKHATTGIRGGHKFIAEGVPLAIKGFEGLQKALASPHGKTRQAAVNLMSQAIHSSSIEEVQDRAIEVLKGCLSDRNKKVRRVAMSSLLRLDVPDDRKREEFVPLVLDLLDDRVALVSSTTAHTLRWRFADAVPLEKAAIALANASERSRPALARLVKAIVAAQK